MDLENFYKNLGIRIKYLRENANLTQEKLAEKAGISLNFMGKMEIGIDKPGLRSLIKLADALNIEVKDLFDFD